MSDSTREPRLNPPDVPLEDKDRQLRGAQAEGDQVFYRRDEEVDRLGELTESELRAGETGDPNVAAEEGMTYVPPTDPPVVPAPDDPEGARVAAGFGTTATDEPYDADHMSTALPTDDAMEARVRARRCAPTQRPAASRIRW